MSGKFLRPEQTQKNVDLIWFSYKLEAQPMCPFPLKVSFMNDSFHVEGPMMAAARKGWNAGRGPGLAAALTP